jgi:signal transduction histidine kinase
MATTPQLAGSERLHGHAAFSPALRLGRYGTISTETAQDIGIAFLLLVTGVLGYFAHVEVEIPDVGVDGTTAGSSVLPILLIAGQTIPLLWRRHAPVLVLGCVTAALFLFLSLGFFPSLASLGLLVALYTVAAHREWSVSIPAALGCGLVLLGLVAFSRQPFELEAVVGVTLFLGAAWVLGDGVRQRRSHVLLLENRATSLELERDQRAREAVAQERRIIARELHDVVAHHVSVMVAQATAAGTAYGDTAPAPILGTIEGLGREALIEMRRLTGLLRADDDPVGWAQPGLDDIPGLVQQVRSAGVPTKFETAGAVRPVPPGLALSAYRIVQEALTNVLKHAGRVHARVVLAFTDSSLELLIENDGVARPAVGDGVSEAGYGQVGMRERVTLYGGNMTIGPVPGGGYVVAVSLPLDKDDGQ